ncbi:hypothetical protein F2Q68_00004436 [Brassica cretica]|uniref:Uncharacterized protein n=1 Tax=Brassica cretica TaxID=69181 RepID=A0A8S9JP22_BRACR|nr:hypothetical protein F2Q68_00004436 [Brassica cretica]
MTSLLHWQSFNNKYRFSNNRCCRCSRPSKISNKLLKKQLRTPREKSVNKEHDRSKSVNSIDDLAAKVDQLLKGNQSQVFIMEEAAPEKSAGDLAFDAEISGDDQQESVEPVSFFMVKPRFCPSRDQFSPVQSSHPLGFGHVLSDQPAASRLEHCRSPGCDVDTMSPMPYRLDYEQQVRNPPMLGMFCGGLVFPRPRTQRVQGNPLFAGSGILRRTGSCPMAEYYTTV